MPHVAAGGCFEQSPQNVLHVGVGLVVAAVVNEQRVLVVLVGQRLVEDREHLVESVVDLPVQPRHLYDDAVVGEAADKRVGHAPGHDVAVIVARLVHDVEHGLLDVAYGVAQDVDRHHGQSVPAVVYVPLVLVLHTEILPKA